MALVERPDGGRLQGARHRPRRDADGLFRAVRARRAVRRHGDGLAQRQRLDRREDGRQPPAHLRAGRDDAAQGHRAQRPLQDAGRRRLRRSWRIFRRATSPISPTGRSSSATSRWSAPAATAPPARSRRRCWRRSAARWCRSTASSTTPSRTTIPNTEDMKMLHAMRDAVLAQQGRRRRSASTATATAAAWSTTRARRFSPTRSA